MATAATKESLKKIILITGEPGVGKTTLMKNVVSKLKQLNLIDIKGFITEEIRNERHSRIGFDVIDINDNKNRASLARVSEHANIGSNYQHQPQVGKYLVTLNSFENIALTIVNNVQDNCLYAIDEIGKMELLSSMFKDSIKDIMRKISKGKFILFATIPTARNKSLEVVEQLSLHPYSQTFMVTHQNRSNLVDDVLKTILNSIDLMKKN